MKTLDFGRGLVSAGAIGVLVAGCGGSQLPIGLSGLRSQSVNSTQAHGAVKRALARPERRAYNVLYRFGQNPDGAYPVGPLTDVNGTLYGATAGGGLYGDGTVFSATRKGKERVLYSFHGGADGSNPNGSLVEMKGVLYGTTSLGGAYGSSNHGGTAFSITTSGVENVLHSFGSGSDGKDPAAGLIAVHGTLYGTTFDGGAYDGGTVFSVTPSGTESVLHSFGYGYDGKNPSADLLDVGGTLYGTTEAGGAVYIGGTVFSITTSGRESVLHSFGTGYNSGTDGALPKAGLINMNGRFYGTTAFGGVHKGGNHPYGTVFSISPEGAENVIYTFDCCRDGAIPDVDLVDVGGALYGATEAGGKRLQCGYVGEGGCGTIFRVTVEGTEKVLHRFSMANKAPNGLTYISTAFYGTTSTGGADGHGAVFTLTP